jgi:hypothetical protein
MKTTIIVLASAALIAAAPPVLARNVSSNTPDQHHSRKHARSISVYAPGHAVHARRNNVRYPQALGYAPSGPKDYSLENSRQAGGGGGGGGSGM